MKAKNQEPEPEIAVYTSEEFDIAGEGLHYQGWRTSLGYCVAGPHGGPLSARLDLGNHSPTGFAWGPYGGSGSAQLALAILADAVGDELAEDYYQRFKPAVMAHLPREGWILARHDVVTWVRYEIVGDYSDELDDRLTVREDGSGEISQALLDRTDA